MRVESFLLSTIYHLFTALYLPKENSSPWGKRVGLKRTRAERVDERQER